MAYTRDHHGNEVDERGFLRAAVEQWAAHGIYPPPLAGDASNPQVLARVKEHRAREAVMTPAQRNRRRQAMQQFIDQWDREHPELARLLTDRSSSL